MKGNFPDEKNISARPGASECKERFILIEEKTRKTKRGKPFLEEGERKKGKTSRIGDPTVPEDSILCE